MPDTETIWKNINFPKDLADKIDTECGKLGLSFSAFIRLRAQSYFDETVFERKDNNNEGGRKNGNTG